MNSIESIFNPKQKTSKTSKTTNNKKSSNLKDKIVAKSKISSVPLKTLPKTTISRTINKTATTNGRLVNTRNINQKCCITSTPVVAGNLDTVARLTHALTCLTSIMNEQDVFLGRFAELYNKIDNLEDSNFVVNLELDEYDFTVLNYYNNYFGFLNMEFLVNGVFKPAIYDDVNYEYINDGNQVLNETIGNLDNMAITLNSDDLILTFDVLDITILRKPLINPTKNDLLLEIMNTINYLNQVKLNLNKNIIILEQSLNLISIINK